MQIVGVQLDIRWENPSVNHTIVSRLSAGVQPGSLVVLPEMFASGFTMNVAAATREWRETEQFVIDLAKRSGSTVVAGVASLGSDRHGRNQAVVVSPGGEVTGRYTKLHPFTLGGEGDCYEAGSEIVTFDWQGFTVAPFVCYDLRFPEIFRVATRRGANLFTVIANWPISRAEHWITLLRARAIENQAYVIGVNRTGRDSNTLYGGHSILVDPMGVIRADAGADETLLMGDVDLSFLHQTRQRLPFLQDLRDEFLPR